MQDKMQTWAAKGDSSTASSILGLLSTLERGELPAAPQPAGLTVQVPMAQRRWARCRLLRMLCPQMNCPGRSNWRPARH